MVSMKGLLVLILFASVVCVYSHHHHLEEKNLTDEQRKKIRDEVEECITESKVDKKLLDDIKDGKDFTPTRELDCFSACVLKKNGVMKEDGTIDQDKPSTNDKVKECRKLAGADACETGGKVMECFAKNNLIPKF
ncbi:general odorant-binding protein 56d [Copidosoma floridanum]|uniref:Odorant-binding protein 8 n=1 Tax=Copidosoma floridanum TaxID=29053 RepID=V9ZAB9_COPFL|nr:general odorant-binding protein 56d [Copidosoma floridanum]AHE40950.1 odorant-binding protein 8 precursor [Copidosoma floridanum]